MKELTQLDGLAVCEHLHAYNAQLELVFSAPLSKERRESLIQTGRSYGINLKKAVGVSAKMCYRAIENYSANLTIQEKESFDKGLRDAVCAKSYYRRN